MKFNDKSEKVKKTKTIRLNKAILIRTEVNIINQVFSYIHVNAAMVRNFSNTTESSNSVINTYTLDDYTDSENLEKLTITELRAISKENTINLQGYRNKQEIINQIQIYFSSKSKSSDLETLPTNFVVMLDENGRVNISLWFKYYGQKLGYNALSRFLNSKQTNHLANMISKKEQLELEGLVHKTNQGVFVHPKIALLAGAYLNNDLFYDIYDFYFIAQPAKIEKQIKKRTKEETSLFLKKLGIKLNQDVKWEKFNIPFAYYIIKINNTVKTGIVGEKKEPKSENLDSRLSTHRSTYARFELINVFEFRASSMVKLFETVTKDILSEYSIQLDRKTRLEQYECFGKDSGQIINDLVSQQFKSMRIEIRHLGLECPKERIDAYNEISLKRLVSITTDDFKDEKNNT